MNAASRDTNRGGPGLRTPQERTATRLLRLGILCVLSAIVVVVEARIEERSSTRAEGTVIYDGRTESPRRDRVRIRFSTGGSVVQFEESPRRWRPLSLGDRVTVLYPPEDPSRARTAASPWQDRAIALVPFLVGIGFLAAAARLRRRARSGSAARAE